MLYTYSAKLLKIVDGDTVDLVFDLGFKISLVQRCRLQGVNTPEIRGDSKEAGIQATEFVKSWFSSDLDQFFIVKSSKPYGDDKYGRFLVRIYKTPNPEEISLNEALVSAGLAVPYMV